MIEIHMTDYNYEIKQQKSKVDSFESKDLH